MTKQCSWLKLRVPSGIITRLLLNTDVLIDVDFDGVGVAPESEFPIEAWTVIAKKIVLRIRRNGTLIYETRLSGTKEDGQSLQEAPLSFKKGEQIIISLAFDGYLEATRPFDIMVFLTFIEKKQGRVFK